MDDSTQHKTDKAWVWHSSDDSIEKQQVSVLACVEIVWSVFLYWLMWRVFDIYWHFFSSLVVAPLLLLRSPESIRAGVSWMRRFRNSEGDISLNEQMQQRRISWMISLASMAVIGSVVWSLTLTWLSAHDGYSLLWRATVMGIFTGASVVGSGSLGNLVFVVVVVLAGVAAGLVAGAVAGVVVGASAGVVAGVVAGVGAGAGVGAVVFVPGLWLMTVMLRFVCTAMNLREGSENFTSNWRENVFVMDPCRLPDLVPGDERTSVKEIWNARWSNNLAKRIIAWSILPLTIIPAWLYRWSIKGSFWFYWPLAYVLNNRLKTERDKARFFARYVKRYDLLGVVLTGFTIFFLTGTTISLSRLSEISNTDPAFYFAYVFAIDLTSVKPWQWLQIVTAVLTGFIVWKCRAVRDDYEASKLINEKFDWNSVKPLQKWVRARSVSTILWLVTAGVFTLAYGAILHGWVCSWLPDGPVAWFADFFGTQIACPAAE